MNEPELIPHLFRTEYSKIVAVLCKNFGLDQIELAEDIVSETFLKASETWGMKGIPDNPRAWLYAVAKNRTKDHLRRKKVFTDKIQPELGGSSSEFELPDTFFSDQNLKDSLLQMMFAVCHPVISPDARIVIALRYLCGFGIEEIASSLLSNKATINKKLLRSKNKLRENQVNLKAISEKHLQERLEIVLTVLYLLFNEGYFSAVKEEKIRKDLCFEAMRLLHVLTEDSRMDLPASNALMALFCFQASRFDARVGEGGEQILFDQQDTSRWDWELIKKGVEYLQRSSRGKGYNRYHHEAIIAYWHTRIDVPQSEKWDHILQAYNRLLQLNYSPVIALNRTYALARVKGEEAALKEALKIQLNQHHLYHLLLAELYKKLYPGKQKEHLELALELAKNEGDKREVRRKLGELV
jgi:RNA polymerase sigma factor (sigma-70 family)